MERRNCQLVIKEMLQHIPITEIEFIEALNENYEDAFYKAPEETIQWERTSDTLQSYMPELIEEWHFIVASIFSTLTIDKLKDLVQK